MAFLRPQLWLVPLANAKAAKQVTHARSRWRATRVAATTARRGATHGRAVHIRGRPNECNRPRARASGKVGAASFSLPRPEPRSTGEIESGRGQAGAESGLLLSARPRQSARRTPATRESQISRDGDSSKELFDTDAAASYDPSESASLLVRPLSLPMRARASATPSPSRLRPSRPPPPPPRHSC